MPYKIQRLQWSEDSSNAGTKSFSIRYLGISPLMDSVSLSFSVSGIGAMSNADMTTYAKARANEVINAALTKLNDSSTSNESIDWVEYSSSTQGYGSRIETSVSILTSNYGGSINVSDILSSRSGINAAARTRAIATLNGCKSATF